MDDPTLIPGLEATLIVIFIGAAILLAVRWVLLVLTLVGLLFLVFGYATRRPKLSKGGIIMTAIGAGGYLLLSIFVFKSFALT